MREIRLLPAILEDVRQVAQWYDQEGSTELADRFLSVFYSYLPRIGGYSEAYPVVYREFRRVLLKPFPYSLYYRNRESWAVVSLVIHAARNPRLWKKVLRERSSSDL